MGLRPGIMAPMLAALGVAGKDIAAGDVRVATGADGQSAGVARKEGSAPRPSGSGGWRRGRSHQRLRQQADTGNNQ